MPFQVVRVIKDAHSDGVWGVAWAHKANRIVTCGVDNAVRIWTLANDTLVLAHTLHGHSLGVVCVSVFSVSKA